LRVLDEHVLQQSVGFVHVCVVMSLADIANLLERAIPHHLPGFAKSLEGVFGLPCHDDVRDEMVEIAVARCVSEIASDADGRADQSAGEAGIAAELGLVLLEHPLMLTHVRYVSRAEIPEPRIVGLALMILERAEQRPMLHYRVVDLGSEKGAALIHAIS
jgi:hypothetical protein